MHRTADALNLSEAMTAKAALAGLDHGGGKTVVILSPGVPAPTGTAREALLLDVGDAVAALAGAYITGPDVGTGPADLEVIARRTGHVLCRPHDSGGSGDSGPATADGALSAVLAVADHRFAARAGSGPAGLRVGVLGVGSVGSHLSGHLAAAEVQLVLADVDPGRRAVADQLGAEWTDPARLPCGTWTSWCPPRSAGCSPRRSRRGCAAPRWSARRTTSSPPATSPHCCTAAGCCGPRTTWSA